MPVVRRLLRDHRRLAAALLALALAVRVLVPAGYMPGTQARVIAVAVCADATGAPAGRQVVIPHERGEDGSHENGGTACPWSPLAAGGLAAADPLLLALAIAFILALGLLPAPVRLPRADRYVRPPLRGPPALS